MRLILFDIDGTLIASSDLGKRTLSYALERAFAVFAPVASYTLTGKTDWQVVVEVLEAAGLSTGEIEKRLPEVYRLMAEAGQQMFFQDGLKPCPGVPELLAQLDREQGAMLGLVSGNAATTAPLKLEAAGIDPNQFRVSAFGSDAADRSALPRLAMQRAAHLTGITFEGPDTVVVGDTPSDIDSARESGSTAVAVASGQFSTSDLARHHPDFLLDNLTDTMTVVDMLLGRLSSGDRPGTSSHGLESNPS